MLTCECGMKELGIHTQTQKFIYLFFEKNFIGYQKKKEREIFRSFSNVCRFLGLFFIYSGWIRVQRR